MGQVLIRNLDDELLADWREIAAANGRSLEAELREVLRRAKPIPPSRIAEVQAEFAAIRAMTPKPITVPSEVLIRRYRDGDEDDED
jgi:plasmid stability protein